MKISVIVATGLQEESITYNTFKILEAHPLSRQHEFNYVFYKGEKNLNEVIEGIKQNDVSVVLTSPFHFGVPALVQDMFEALASVEDNDIKEKYFTAFTTSVRLFDNLMHNGLENMIKSAGFEYLPALSLGMCDVLNEKINKYCISQNKCTPEVIARRQRGESKSEGLERAVQWLMVTAMFVNNEPVNLDGLNILIADTSSSSEYGHKTINLKDYRLVDCDSCKICYTTKVCKYKDDMDKLEAVKKEADIIIYTGSVWCGTLAGGNYKRMLDREVHNGLMPYSDKKQYIGYLIDNIGDSTVEIFKENCIAGEAFGENHFLGVLENNRKNFNQLIRYASYLHTANALPQINCYSEKIGRHFADLAKSIPTVLPKEKEFYSKAGAYDEIKEEPFARPIENMETAKAISAGRITPYRKMAEALSFGADKSKECNPLDNVYDSNGDISEAKVDVLVDLTAREDTDENERDPFYSKSKKSFLTALIYYVLENNDIPKEEKNFSTVLNKVLTAMTDSGKENNPLTVEIQTWFSKMNSIGRPSKAKVYYDTFLIAPEKTGKAVIASTAVDLKILIEKKS